MKSGMGVPKAWRFRLKLAILQNGQNENGNGNGKGVVWWRSANTTSSWSVVCGIMLFGLGLISLFTGHVASHLEWYSQRLGNRTLYSTLVCFLFLFLF